MAPIDVEAEIDRLYREPLPEFTAGRNALAVRLRAAGRAEEAERVKALARPTSSAWATNQVYWRARPEFEAVVRAGDALRSAQQALFAGRRADLREALSAREAAIGRAVARAMSILGETGSPASAATRRKLAVTFEAIAARGGAWREPRGRLSGDLDLPTFETLRTALGGAGASGRGAGNRGGPARVLPMPPAAVRRLRPHGARLDRREGLKRLRAEQAEAERELRQRRQAAEQAAAAERAAAEALEQARGAVQDAERRLEWAQDREGRASRALDAARARRARLGAALADAEQTLARARAALDEAT